MLTEDLVEKLTPEKSDDDGSEADRLRVLEAIATVCMNQRQYHLATKKYTQAGNRIKVSCMIGDICVSCLSRKTLENCENMYIR